MLFLLGATATRDAGPVSRSVVEPTSTPLPIHSGRPPAWIAFEQAWKVITGYRTTITVFEKKGTIAQKAVLDYTFRRPSQVTVQVVEGPNSGVTLDWNGGDTAIAHRRGLLAIFKKKLSLHDPLVTTIRGSSIDELSFAAFLAHGLATPGSMSQSSGPAINGISTEAVTMVPTSSVRDSGLTREVMLLSSLTNLPTRVLGYDGLALVRQIDFSNVKLER